MGFNIFGNIKNMGKFISIANRLKNNPKGAINEALTLLEKKNPNGAKIIRDAINSNKNPAEFLKEQANKGNITKENLNDLKSYYSLMQSCGLSKQVPDTVWNTVEDAIKTNSNQSSGNGNNSGFSGF